MTRWRSVLERATTRHHMSPGPVIVHASSSSGIVARCRPTASCPPRPPGPCRISRVRNAVTGWSSAAGSSSGPQPETMPLDWSRSSRACTVPRATPEPARGLEDPDPGLGGEQFDQCAVELVHRRPPGCAICPVCRRARCAHCLLRRSLAHEFADPRRDPRRPDPRPAPAAGRPRGVRRGARRLPGDRVGRDRLRRRQRDPDRALLPVRVGHGAESPTPVRRTATATTSRSCCARARSAS